MKFMNLLAFMLDRTRESVNVVIAVEKFEQ